MGGESRKLQHGLTFGGHPVAAAAANANLAILDREQLPRRSAELGAYQLQQLQTALDGHPNVGEIRGMGLFTAIELVRDRTTGQPLEEEQLMGWLSAQLKGRGVRL